MTDFEQGTLLTLEEVVDDLDATITMALNQRHGDDDSTVLVPIWELRVLLEAARVR